jgi:hypothetical protein
MKNKYKLELKMSSPTTPVSPAGGTPAAGGGSPNQQKKKKKGNSSMMSVNSSRGMALPIVMKLTYSQKDCGCCKGGHHSQED